MVRKYELVDYFDVWGNEIDGWEVNDQTVVFRDLNMTDDCTDDELISYLIDHEWLSEKVRGKVSVEWSDPSFGEIFETETLKPLYGVREVM